MLLAWDWIGFGIGLFGAFIMEYSRFMRQVKIPTQTFLIGKSLIKTEKINKLAFLTSLSYIIIGGVIAGTFATTKMEAFLYGIFWQALFTFYINLNREK